MVATAYKKINLCFIQIFYASIEPTVNVRQSQYKHMNEYIDIHPGKNRFF